MDDRDRWLGRTLLQRELVARDELVAAANVCNTSAQAGRPVRLLEALLTSNAITPAQATWIETTILNQAPAPPRTSKSGRPRRRKMRTSGVSIQRCAL